MEKAPGLDSPAATHSDGALAQTVDGPMDAGNETAFALRSTGFLGEDLRPLTVIQAPKGWGKTELLEAWLSALPEQTLRFVVDGEAVDWLHDLQSWSERLPEPGVAVIDGCERATSTANDFALLRTVVANPNLFLMVASRRCNILDTPVAALRVDTALITRADLALNDREVGDVELRISEVLENPAKERILRLVLLTRGT